MDLAFDHIAIQPKRRVHFHAFMLETHGRLRDARASEEGDPIEGRRLFSAGDRLPVGVSAFPGKDENDLALWVESRRALAVGDTLIDRGRGLQIPVDWLSEGVTREQVVAVLRPLLELPVELVLPTHGAPTDRAALERALS